MSKKLEAQLKPCPYCGGKGRIKFKPYNGHKVNNRSSYRFIDAFVRCETCHARTIRCYSLEGSVDVWNAGNVVQGKNIGGSIAGLGLLNDKFTHGRIIA